MGAFYGSVHLRTDDREAIRKVLERLAKKQQARFLLGPEIRGWVGVYPEAHGQDARVAKAIAGKFPGTVLYVMVHDDDFFAYTLYQGGRAVDQYNSCPDYFDDFGEGDEESDDETGADLGGRPEAFRDLLPDGRALEHLRALLSAPRPLFSGETLQRFAEILRLPNAVTCYEYLNGGETKDIEGWDDFVHVPDQRAAKAGQRAADADLAATKQRLRADGLLLLEQVWGNPLSLPTWCADREGSGFLGLGATPVGRRESPVEHHGPPWGAPLPAVGILADVATRVLEVSPSGRYLAVGDALGKTRLWDLDYRTQPLEVAQPRHVVWIGFTPDGKHLITLSAEQAAVTALDGGQRVGSCPIVPARVAAVHPSGTLVVADEMGKLTFLDLPSARPQKTLLAGGQFGGGPAPERAPGEVVLRKVDPAALQEKLEAALQQQLAQVEPMHLKVREAYRKAGRPEPPDLKERMQEELRRVTETIRPQLERLLGSATAAGQVPAAAAPLVPARGAERVTALEISADGRWLCYACQNGVRALAWDDVLVATTATPAPRYTAESEPVAITGMYGLSTEERHTYALAWDAGSGRLLFAGLEGRVRFLDLADGGSGVLLDLPGRPPVLRMALSRDRSALGCTCLPGQFDQGRNRRPPLLQVWNYARLSGDEPDQPTLRLFPG
jgi:hypothetical protein